MNISVARGQSAAPARIRGIILRAEEDSLVVQATPDEVARFTAKDPVTVDGRMAITPDAAMSIINGEKAYPNNYTIQPGERLFNISGWPVAIVDRVTVRRDAVDVTGAGPGEYRRYALGHLRIELSAFGPV